MDTKQPNNPYAASVVTGNTPIASDHHPLIDSLDVSDGWKRKFHLIADLESFTNPKDKRAYMKSLSWGDRFGLSNILAFLFSWIYFFIKGMWKAGLAYLGIWIALIVVLAVFDVTNDTVTRIVGLGYSAMAMTRANLLYYSKKVLNKDLWL